MAAHGRARLFPVGLYATLLGALCWLAVPGLTRPVEGGVLAAAALPLQGYAAALGVLGSPEDGAVMREIELYEELGRRQELVAVGGARQWVPTDLQPVHCRVLSRGGRGGGGGAASELILDRSYRELSDCTGWVTFGDGLVGFLAAVGRGPAADDEWEDRARVLLLNHPRSPSVPAFLEDPDLGRLRFSVEAAGSVDRWPLRTRFHEDPYRAVRLGRRDAEVFTDRLQQSVFEVDVPPGLRLGRSRLWGYEGLPIGVFVEPEPPLDEVASVVLWRRNAAVPSRLRQPFEVGAASPVRLLQVPTAGGSRYYVDGIHGELPDGAALVDGVRLLGRVHGFAFGTGLGEPFGLLGQRWDVIVLPDDRSQPPRTAVVTVAAAAEGLLELHADGGLPESVGHLFTGVNGRHCPAGLYLGPVRSEPGRPRVLQLRWVGVDKRRGQGVYVQGTGP